jgi:hypothetical protein
MSTAPLTPFDDPAKPILQNDPAVTDDLRAQAWDHFHGSADANDLAGRLQDMAIPDDTKKKLYQAKQAMTPTPVVDPIAKTQEVMKQIAAMDPQVLEAAESHPNVLKTLTAAAGIGAKGAGESAGKPAAAGKAKTPAKTKIAADYPPTPSGHAFVKASDGGHYHIPVENVEKARAIDPHLQVLHVAPNEAEA